MAKNAKKSNKKDAMLDTDLDNIDLTATLKQLLSDLVTFYLQAHGAHWNIIGPNFSEYHELFGEIYADVYSSIDPTAENLRKLGAKAPFNLSDFMSLRSLAEVDAPTNAPALANELLNQNNLVLDVLNDAYEVAEYCDQQGIATFIADRIDKHQYWKWQLTASLGLEITEPSVDLDMNEAEPLEVEEPQMKTPEKNNSEHNTKSFSASVINVKASTAAAPYGEVTALVSVFNNVDYVNDRVMPGAFAKSLNDYKTAGKSIPFVWSHQWNNPEAYIGKIVEAKETLKGLEVKAYLYNTPVAQHVRELLTDGVVTQFSFAYDTISEQKGADGANELLELRILEAGPTLKGCNPDTEIVEAKSTDPSTTEDGTILNVENTEQAKPEELEAKSEELIREMDSQTALALVEAEIASL